MVTSWVALGQVLSPYGPQFPTCPAQLSRPCFRVVGTQVPPESQGYQGQVPAPRLEASPSWLAASARLGGGGGGADRAGVFPGADVTKCTDWVA